MLASGYTYIGQRYYIIAPRLVLITLQPPLPTSQTPRSPPCNHIPLPRRLVGHSVDRINRLRHGSSSSSSSSSSISGSSRCGLLGSCSRGQYVVHIKPSREKTIRGEKGSNFSLTAIIIIIAVRQHQARR